MITEIRTPTVGMDHVVVTCNTDNGGRLYFCVRPVSGGPEQAGESTDRIACENEFLHSIRIEGLKPDTPYAIMVRDGSGHEQAARVRTLQAPAGKHLVRFGVLADPHISVAERADGWRLFESSAMLVEKSLDRMAGMGARFVLVPGDVVDVGNDAQLDLAVHVFNSAAVDCRVVIGNHEYDPEKFKQAFGIGEGYYFFNARGLHVVMLDTPRPLLDDGQIAWLKSDLDEHADMPTVIASHYCLAPHEYLACVADHHIENHTEVRTLLGARRQVKACFAGHKNIPSVQRDGHMVHVTSPQVVTYDCAFDIVDVYEDGLVRVLYEIEDRSLLRFSQEHMRQMHQDKPGFSYGLDAMRNFTFMFDG